MELDIEKTLKQMLGAVKKEAAQGWTQIKNTVKLFLERKKQRYEMIASMLLSGQISEAKFKSILDDEKLLLESEILALSVISKAAAQKAANAALEILEDAIRAVLGEIE